MFKYFLFFVVLILFACSDIGKSEQIESIDKMTKTIDSLSIVLSEHPIDKIEEVKGDFYEIENIIRLNLKVSDTIDLELGKKLDALKRIRAAFNPLVETSLTLKKNFQKELELLKKLKDDITNSNGERVNYSKNVIFEQKKINDLKNLLLTYTKEREEAIKIFYQYKGDMENFASSISNEE